jgi:hypothetical protein
MSPPQLAVLITGLLLVTAHSAHAQGICRPADQATARVTRDLTRAVSGADAGSVQERAQQQLPSGGHIRIDVVTDEQICQAVLEPYDAETQVYDRSSGRWSEALEHVYVVRVDSVYVVWAPERSVGEFGQVVTLNRNYQVLAAVLH